MIVRLVLACLRPHPLGELRDFAQVVYLENRELGYWSQATGHEISTAICASIASSMTRELSRVLVQTARRSNEVRVSL